MGNNFCSNIDINTQEALLQKEVELNGYQNMQIRSKLKTQSQRLDTIYSIKQQNNKEEFILSIKPYNDLESEDSVTVTLHNREYNHFNTLYNIGGGDEDGINDYKFQIEEQVILDDNQDNYMYTRVQDKNTNERYSIKAINFDDIQDIQFKQGVYEIAIHNKLKNSHDGENHPNIIQLKDSYILHCNERLAGKKCLILVYEYFDATLTEIIQFRKQNDWKYTEKQISAILRDLVSAVHLMHHLGITHRDIRPSNIAYSSSDKHFKIMGFQEAKIMENFNLVRQVESQKEHNKKWDLERLNTVRGVPEFMSPEILDQLHVNSEQQVISYDAFKLDVYSLGVLIILIKQQNYKLEFKAVESKIKENEKPKISIDFSNWTLSGIVKKMVKSKAKERAHVHELHMECQTQFPVEEYPRTIECQLVQSLRYKTQKDTKEEYIQQQSLIASQYYNIYDMDMWLFKQSEILEEYIQKDQEVQKADVQFIIAEGYLQHSDLNRARDFYEKAAFIYNSLGHEFTQASNLEPAIDYYNKAIDCVRKANNGEETSEQALLLENIGNAYRLKGELQKARAFQEEALLIIGQIKGEGSIEVARILNNIANVYAQLGFYKKADKRLKRALKISEQIYLEEDEKLQLQALCMTNLGEVHRLKGNLQKAQTQLEEALNIREQLLGSGHLQVADTVENLGNVEFDLGNYHQARKHYERSLVIKRSKLAPDNPEIALTLNNIGNVCKNMEEFEKAKKMYEDALLILNQKFGNEGSHPYMAISYGNMGIINIEQGNRDNGQDFIMKSLNILEQIVGVEHPDYQFYQSYIDAPQQYQQQQYYNDNNQQPQQYYNNNQSPQQQQNYNTNNYQERQFNNNNNQNNNWQQYSPSNF